MNRAAVQFTLACALSLSLTACTDRSATAQAEQPTAAPAAAGSERKILYWKSPMDPTFIAQAPGKDSMGMDLVPVYAGEQSAGPPGMVKIDPVTIQNIGVKTAVVARKRLSRDIRTVGRIAYDEQKVRHVAPKLGGWIEEQHVNFPGQVVRKGERLLAIYSPELVATQEEYLIALRYRGRLKDSALDEAIAGSEGLVQAAKTRLRYWNITERQIKALRERGEITRTMVLHAPFKGIIVKKNIPEGGYVQPGQSIYTIADISTVWVYADIYEYEAPWLQIGQPATMTLAYQPGASYHGTVVYIYPYLKNMTRTLQVRMEFSNSADFALKPDMWANVELHSAVAREGLAVPIQAVIRTGKRNIALVALDGGRFAPRDLRLGAQVGDDFEVLDGLQEGERVVTSAQFLINSESSLQSAISKMLAATSEDQAGAASVGMPGMSKTPAAATGMPGMAATPAAAGGMPGMSATPPAAARMPATAAAPPTAAWMHGMTHGGAQE
ncbi:MAG: efflux RND transporter periplasmic adaptor subunit [Candidatus Binatia bacterium]